MRSSLTAVLAVPRSAFGRIASIRRSLASTLGALSVVLASGAACQRKGDVSFEVVLPGDLADRATWIEVAAYQGSSCAAVKPMLGGGAPEGATARATFRRDAKGTPPLGDMPRARYAFGAVARGDDCSVIASGCEEAAVPDDTKSVRVSLTPVDPATGACELGATCQAGRCLPASDNSNPGVGAGCSLDLLGAGPLANSVAGQGTYVSAPAIAPTRTGFVIAYREIDPSVGTKARITLMTLDTGGGAGTPYRPDLPGRCANSAETDGIGLLVNNDQGMLALARAPCPNAKPALELLNITTQPSVVGYLVSTAQTDVRLSFSPSKGIAYREAGNVAVFNEGGAGRIATMQPTAGIGAPSGSFGATTGVTGAWVAASDKVLALLASTSGGQADGGADPSAKLHVLLADIATPPDTFNAATDKPAAPIAFPGQWGSIAAIGTRALVASDDGSNVALRTFDLGNTAVVGTDQITVDAVGQLVFTDVTVHGERAYFATYSVGSIQLDVYDSVTTKPKPLRRTVFEQTPSMPLLGALRDGRIAVAASDTRVAVVWTTTSILGANDVVGGYALFACTQ